MADSIAGIRNVYTSTLGQVKGLLGNPVATAAGGAIAGAVITGTTIAAVTKTKKTRRKVSKTKSRRYSPRRNKRTRRTVKYARTARKKKDRSTRRIRMTKNGQPYIILKSGKARFISKKSARSSRKRRGGRY